MSRGQEGKAKRCFVEGVLKGVPTLTRGSFQFINVNRIIEPNLAGVLLSGRYGYGKT
jgi:hypothetical protein